MTDSATDWLDLPSVSPGKKLPGERKRARTMQKSPLGKSRTWASDGEYVYFRRKQANPETLKRHETFLKTGDYKHIETQDDVEVYKLMPASPFARKVAVDLGNLDYSNLRRAAAIAACAHDWALFHDALEELAGRIKAGKDPAFAKTIYDEQLQYIFVLIDMRGGPSRREIDREFAALRQRRGVGRGNVIVLPPSIAVSPAA